MISPEDLKERCLEDRSAWIFVESLMFEILGASNVGLGSCGIFEGEHRYTYYEAISIIKQIDKMLPSAPKQFRKRIQSTRMGFILAFGPQMLEVMGEPLNKLR